LNPASLRRWSPAIVASVAILGYLNAIANGYVMDDRGILVLNPLVTHADGIWRAFAHPYWPAGLGGQYRPLTVATFSLDWWISGGDPRWLHAANVLWDAAAAVLVWLLAAELLAPVGALAAALLFALTPLHVEAVANVVGRAECMTAAFVLAALLAHRKGAWLAPLWFALALLSKENGIVFLALAVAHDLLLAGPSRDALRARRALYAGYAAVAAAYGAILLVVFRDAAFSAPAHTFDGSSTGERLLTVAATIPQYARLLLLPFDLSADYQPGVLELTRSITLPVLLGLLLALLLGVVIFREWRRTPVLAFALLWVPIAIAPVSNLFFVTGVLLAERTLYLPSVGAMLALGWVMQSGWERAPKGAWAALGVVLVAFAARTWTRTAVWHDSKTFALTLVSEHPEAYRGHWVIGRVYAAMGRFGDAEKEFATAREIFPGDPVVWRESAELRIVAKDWTTAEAMLDRALVIRPKDVSDRMRLAEVRMEAGDARGAVAEAREVLALAPDSVRAAFIIGSAARAMRDPALADSTFARMTALHPDSWEMQMGYADVLLVKGDTADAIVHADRAVALSAGAPPAVAVRARARGARP
jgi:cytochrome c-type biogenesis protein CcmH/NrfG